MRPQDLVLRCYGYKRRGKWFGVCLELNLAAEACSLDDLKAKLKSMVFSYIQTICDTEDKESIPKLLQRRAPILDWIRYYSIFALCHIQKLPDKKIFDEIMPFTLAPGC